MKKRDIFIVVLSSATALACVGFTIWGNLKNDGVLTIDVFMGVIATLIGVCATIVVGFQIANFIELKETKIQIEKLQRERERLEISTQNISKLKSELASAFVAIGATTQDPQLKVISYILSICVEDNVDSCSKLIISRYEYLSMQLRIVEKQKLASPVFKKFNDKLRNISYPSTLSDYSKISKLQFDIVSRIDKLLETYCSEEDK